MELLRIVSMLMVLAVHADGAALGLPALHGETDKASAYDLWRLAIESIAIIGVNCFTMISGYFGIHLRWRSAASYLFQCAFYSVGIYSILMLIFPGRLSAAGWAESWLVLSHTDLWYVPAYFGLMLLSPILNAGIKALDRRQYTLILTAFTLFNIWCGWWWQGSFNPTGYTLVQLIFVYVIARYIRLHVSLSSILQHRSTIAATYLLSTAGIFASSLYMDPLLAFAYNSPFVLLSTVSLFSLFTTIRIQSGLINYAAQSAFAAYLIHKAPLIWGNVMKPAMLHMQASLAGWQLALAGCCIVAAFYILAMIIDPVRRILSRILLGR
ncbi:MAG: acyltransferase [Muribaculaceae bacterium]|nr:acyltransferase [Muribaculaceae bacterium]